MTTARLGTAGHDYLRSIVATWQMLTLLRAVGLTAQRTGFERALLAKIELRLAELEDDRERLEAARAVLVAP